jgi:hypothetical protein
MGRAIRREGIAMPKLRDVCRYVRSKNAGPFWVTIDLFFKDAESFRKYHTSEAISADRIAQAYGVDPALVKYFVAENLNVVKISFPRKTPQGGVVERDMHQGQQYVRLLSVELE